jgi:hypothetical protein
MAKKKRLSRDQRRKAKLTERARKSPAASSLAYTGDKYKTDELTPVFLRTETGIYETYVMTDRQLTDATVQAALVKLIHQLRAGGLPPLEEQPSINAEEDLVIWNIRRNWHDLFASFPHPGTDNLIGVLRTLLSSIDTWSTPSPTSRGYLNFVEGFLRKAGVKVQKVKESDLDHLEDLEDEPEDELVEIGREGYRAGDQRARVEFLRLADELIASGQWERVANAAQQLIGEINSVSPAMAELSALSLRAQGYRPPGLT